MGFLVFVDWVSARWLVMFSTLFQIRRCSFHSWINAFHICIEMILDMSEELRRTTMESTHVAIITAE